MTCAASGAATPRGGPGWGAATTASRPESALARAAGRVAAPARLGPPPAPAGRRRSPPVAPAGALERGRFLALDAMLGLEELAGFTLSNRPRREARAPGPRGPGGRPLPRPRRPAGRLRADPGGRARGGCGASRGAGPAGRPGPDHRLPRGRRRRRAAAGAGAAAHRATPCAARAISSAAAPGRPRLAALAPAVARLVRDGDARVHPLGGEEARAVAARLARLAGRRLET